MTVSNDTKNVKGPMVWLVFGTGNGLPKTWVCLVLDTSSVLTFSEINVKPQPWTHSFFS